MHGSSPRRSAPITERYKLMAVHSRRRNERAHVPTDRVERHPWLTGEDLAYYVEQYQVSGFRDPLNWYRNAPTNNSITPELESKRFTQPAAFVAGAEDEASLEDHWCAAVDRHLVRPLYRPGAGPAGDRAELGRPDPEASFIVVLYAAGFPHLLPGPDDECPHRGR